MDKKKAVGRPKKTGERKVSRTVSILPAVEKKAIKHFGSLGLAIEFAVTQKDNSLTGG